MSTAIGRNYAATLFELASREDALEPYGELLAQIATVYRETPAFRSFLETPRVSQAEKQEAIRASLGDRAPEMFLRFLLVVLEQRRQRALPAMARAYDAMLDERLGRTRATVTLACGPGDRLRVTA